MRTGLGVRCAQVGASRAGPALALLAALLCPGPGVAQDPAEAGPRVTLEVRQVAGENVYLDLGTRGGLAAGDTVEIRRSTDGPVVGTLTVVAATEARSVLVFAEGVFPLASGDTVVLGLLREPLAGAGAGGAVPGADAVSGPPVGGQEEALPAAMAERPKRGVSGRVSLEVGVSHATTGVGLVDPVDVSRTLATPALRLDLTAPDLPGGFTLRTRGRVTHRYTSGTPFDRPTTLQVQHLSLERRFTRVPLQLSLGRFFSPVESFSGFWDGVALRFGGEGFGAGVLAGFEPDLWNRNPSLDFPKATAFLDYRAGGGSWRWEGDLSAHFVSPRPDGVGSHAFAGLGQRIAVGPLRVRAELQADRNPDGGGVEVSQALTRVTLTLSPTVSLRAGASRRSRYSLLSVGDPFGPRRDRVGGGVSLRGGAAYLSLDGALNRYENGEDRTSVTAALSLSRLPGLSAVGWSANGSWWTGDTDRAVTAGTAFSFRLGPARVRAGYRLQANTFRDRTRMIHAPDLFLDVPLGEHLSLTARTRGQFGDRITSQYLHLSLTRVFRGGVR